MRGEGIFELDRNSHGAGTNTWSIEARQLAQQWIAQCVTEHVHCNRKITQDDWLPTRLLDIRALDGSETDVFLIESKDLTSKPQYATLSHCWGRAPVLSLRAENIALFKKGIPVRSLPRTFRQAVEVARYLQLEFLWIDSLCIIQGSIADWQVESLTMMSVYQNAFCNIAATGSHNSQGGLFFERDPSLVSIDMVNLRWNGASPQGEYCFYPITIWINGVASAPLNKRAWVVQERLLARRVLHFGAQSLFFECCEHEACETFPTCLPQIFHGANSVNQFKRIYGTEEDLSNNRLTEHRLWERVVQAFTRSNLTHESDKVVSLSGIAEEFQRKIIKDKYVAGLWETALEDQLLWQVTRKLQANGTPSKRPPFYRAPSWSWLSIDAVITTFQPSHIPALIEIKHTHIDLLNDNHPTGQIIGGHIIVSCHLLQATHGRRIFSDLNIPTDYLLFEGCEIGTTQVFFDEASKKPANDEFVFCLPISGSLESHRWMGLVLSPTSAHEAEYQRIGFYQATDEDFSEFYIKEKEATPKKTIKII